MSANNKLILQLEKDRKITQDNLTASISYMQNTVKATDELCAALRNLNSNLVDHIAAIGDV